MIRRVLSAAAMTILAPMAMAQDFKVVTTFTVIAEMAKNVAGDAAEVVSVTKPGAEIHGYEPTPQDLVGALDADLILWNGMNLELWFEQFLRNLGDKPSVTVSEGIDPIPISEGSYEGKPNPHAWMGMENALIYVDNIRDALSEHDPDNAAVYAANAARYKEEITAQIAPLRALIASVPKSSVGSRPAKGRSAIWRGILGCKRSISGR